MSLAARLNLLLFIFSFATALFLRIATWKCWDSGNDFEECPTEKGVSG